MIKKFAEYMNNRSVIKKNNNNYKICRLELFYFC